MALAHEGEKVLREHFLCGGNVVVLSSVSRHEVELAFA